MIGPVFTAMFLVMWIATAIMALDAAMLDETCNDYRAYCALAVMAMTFIFASALQA